jgi:ATP/maltotriose-dependent transcriptional regulator MalT
MKNRTVSRPMKPSRDAVSEARTADDAWHGSPQARRRHQDPVRRLTQRELQVLALLCEGLSNKEIGRRLQIAAQTVKVHVGNILRALEVSTRLQAVLTARCWELARKPGASAGTAGPRRAEH